jgi:AraC-like DNA-binding protein
VENLFLIGAIQAFFLALVLSAKSSKSLPDRFLIFWMAFLGIHLAGVYLGASGFYRDHPRLFGYDAAFLLLEGPCLLIYILLATQKEGGLKWSYVLHSVPFLFFTLYNLYLFQWTATPDRLAHISAILNDPGHVMIQVFGGVIHFHLIIYLVWSWTVLRKFSANLQNEFSYSEGIDMAWLKAIVFGLSLVCLLILIGLVISDVLAFVSHDAKAYMIYAAFSVLPFYLLFNAIRHGLIYPYAHVQSEQRKYESSALDKTASKAIAHKLDVLMITEKPYLHSKLTIAELADKLDIHPKYLSQVINENFNQNFFNYINHHRVEEVKQRIALGKYDHLTLLGIGLDCGFNTKSSFNSIFRKMTGQTPQAFKAKQ